MSAVAHLVQQVRSLRQRAILTCANVAAAVFVACVVAGSFAALGAVLASPAEAADARVVLIHDSTGAVHQMPLGEDGVLEVRTDAGVNVVRVQDGRAFMESADCDGQDCVHQGALEAPGAQVICLPHQLWMEVADAGASASALDVSAVAPSEDGAADTGLDVVSR